MEMQMIQMARSPKQFGAALQQQRSQQGLSQSSLADLIGTGQKTISKIENGNPATKLETLFSLLAALDLELEIKPRSKSNPNDQWEDYL
jgi:HTH-type transcriptional regulator/antitoxin HipB